MSIDSLGYYPQVYGHFSLINPITEEAPIFVAYDTTIEDINCTNTAGVISVTDWGIYLIDVCVEYAKTAISFGTEITLQANASVIGISSIEAAGEHAAIDYNRLSLTKIYSMPKTDSLTEFRVDLFAYPVASRTITTSIDASTYIKIIRLR